MRITFLIFTMISISFSALIAEDNKLGAEDFLKAVKNPPGREFWVSMAGKTFHRRRGQEKIEAKIYLAIKFSQKRTLAQLVLNNNEAYSIGQTYENGRDSTTIDIDPGSVKDRILGQLGLRPDDLTMSFLFWKFIKEYDSESIKGRDCRVFKLESPEKVEYVKVYIDIESHFPLKVNWYNINSTEATRTLEIKSVKKVDEIYLVSSLHLYGPGWDTKVEFSELKTGSKDKPDNHKLFRKLEDKK